MIGEDPDNSLAGWPAIEFDTLAIDLVKPTSEFCKPQGGHAARSVAICEFAGFALITLIYFPFEGSENLG